MNLKTLVSYSLVLIAGLFPGCQEAIVEIDTPSESTSISPNSALARLISLSTLKDGSFDNILDNASSISIKLPVSVLANNQELLIESVDDFNKIEDIFDEEKFVKDSLFLIYPATAIFADYSEVVLENQTQLDEIVMNSIEGGNDEDIECFNLKYPLKFSLYDQLNQLAGISQINNDQKLYELLRRLNENEIGAFSYPINIYDSDGEETAIQNNTELKALLQIGASQCDEQDEPYYIDEDIILPTSTLRVILTDAPFPTDLVAEANVHISKIELRSAGSDDNSFLVLSEEAFSFNLLDLTNGVTATLVDMQVPLGSYDEIRMLVTDADVLLKDGETFDLKIPSGSTSGIKVKLNNALEVAENNEYDILVDFDVSKSFKVQGNPNTPAGIKGFIFTPVIKAVIQSQTGTISGHVMDESSTSGIPGVQLSVYAADTLNTTAFTNVNGDYKILGLVPGTYNVTAEHTDYVTKSENGVAVVITIDTEVNFELTQK